VDKPLTNRQPQKLNKRTFENSTDNRKTQDVFSIVFFFIFFIVRYLACYIVSLQYCIYGIFDATVEMDGTFDATVEMDGIFDATVDSCSNMYCLTIDLCFFFFPFCFVIVVLRKSS
jgi:hypothetical protein